MKNECFVFTLNIIKMFHKFNINELNFTIKRINDTKNLLIRVKYKINNLENCNLIHNLLIAIHTM